jgi:Na+-transporting NADH:ubiquinone oxidoreductase subunit NqrB
MNPGSISMGFRNLHRFGFERDELEWCAAICPPLVLRCVQDGADIALQRLSMLAIVWATAYIWSALLARRPWPTPIGAQLLFAMLFALMSYEPISWGSAVLAASFGWVFAREMFGGRPVLSPALVALAFALFAASNGGVEEQWITNAEPDLAIAAASLPGALWLLWRQSLAWPIGIGVVLGVAGAVGAFPPTALWWEHLFIGSLIVGILFIAADRRFVPEGFWAQMLYGGLIGALVVIMRLANPDQPDGVVFALLLGGLFAPLLGRLCAWRINSNG